MGNDEQTMADNAGRANPLFGKVVVETLRRLGVEHFVISPGSRSTPLALAVAELPENCRTVCLDERSAAFRAVGRVKATRRPAALVCTSGTAAAHYYPAIIEARETALPLIVLTADRPPELRHCHAGQTIDQSKLYGTYPVFTAELPVPEADPLLLRQVREICRRALESAMGPAGGPAHLNCPFREPFFGPEETAEADRERVEQLLKGLEPVKPVISGLAVVPDLPGRTLILAGPRPWRELESEVAALAAISRDRGWPILTDGANPLRHGDRHGATIITQQDCLVRSDRLWERLRPEAVLMWGEPPTSKMLRQRLAELDVPGWLAGSGKAEINPFHGRISWIGGTIEALGASLADSEPSGYAAEWAAAEAEREKDLDKRLAKAHSLFEGDVHRLLGRLLPPDAQVFMASSLTIRDAEWFMPRRKAPLLPYSQRGANGIDGTLSLARGIAEGSGEPVYLVTGDLAFLHDAGGLAGSASDRPGIFVVLLNNGGGGIFELLPVARRTPHFEELFGTPQEVDFRGLVAAHGGRHALCATLEELEFAFGEWDGNGLMVAEVVIDRKASAELHRALLKPE